MAEDREASSGRAKAICWDVDGTLVDTEPLYKEALMAAAAAHGAALPEGDALNGIGAREAWKYLHTTGAFDILEEQYLDDCATYYLAHQEKIVPRPGAAEAFRHFEGLGLPQCAVSSGTRLQVASNIERSGIGEGMLFYVDASDVTATKPDPQPYLLAKAVMCRGFGWDEVAMDSRSFVAVEDSIGGVLSAKRAGLTAIFWNEDMSLTAPMADYTARTPADLLRICQRLTSAAPTNNSPSPADDVSAPANGGSPAANR